MNASIQDFASLLGTIALCIGSTLKLFLLVPILNNNFSIQGIPIPPLYTETFAWYIAIVLNIRQGNPLSAWGEGVFIFICNLWILYLYLNPFKRFWTLILGLCLLFPLLNALPEPLLGLSCAPLFLGGGFLLILHHNRIGHIGTMSPWIFVLGTFCGWSRTFTAFIQIHDPIAHLSSLLGACISTILLGQVIYYRQGTRAFLKSIKKND